MDLNSVHILLQSEQCSVLKKKDFIIRDCCLLRNIDSRFEGRVEV